MLNKILKYLVGPELLWLLACLWASTFKKANVLHEGHYNQIIENWATFLPVIMLVLSMCLFAIPVIPKKFLLLRIILVAIIGTNFLLEYTLNAHTEGGPGVGTIYIVGYFVAYSGSYSHCPETIIDQIKKIHFYDLSASYRVFLHVPGLCCFLWC
ncbi:MAG TPA: hypothetical protein VI603_00305 [Saprospiraceae bacterium]|nr:hypothetical protein [Saprospiraceae bacterium]